MLAQLFTDLESDGSRDKTGWFWRKNSETHDFPQMNPPLAFIFKLIETLNAGQFSSVVTQGMKSYLSRSSQVLSTLPHTKNTSWRDKFRIVSRNQPLWSVEITPKILTTVYEALLNEQQLRVLYRRRSGEEAEYDIHSLGLVFRDCVVYLVATLWNYNNIKQLALHCFQNCQLLDQPSLRPESFNLDEYIEDGAFEYSLCDSKTIQLVVLFASRVAYHLQETPLHKNQFMEVEDNGWVRVTASVKNT